MDMNRTLDRMSFGLTRRAAFYADMYAFTGAGIPAFQALERMIGVARRRYNTKRLANVYASIAASMRAGNSLAKSLSQWVPAAEAVMINGADSAGGDVLRATFKELASLLERQRAIRTKLMSVVGINLLSIGVIVAVIVSVMHTLVPALDKAATPAMEAHMSFAPIYFATGKGILDYGPYVLVALIALGFWVMWLLPNWTGSRRLTFDSLIPPFTLYQRAQATYFLSSAASMMRAGITLKSVLTDTGKLGSKWLRWHVERMSRSLDAGRQEVTVLANGLLPRETGDRLEVYSLIPDFTGIMTRLAEDNFQLYEGAIKKIGNTMTAVSILLLAGFAASTLFAMFDFSNALQASVTAMKHAAGG